MSDREALTAIEDIVSTWEWFIKTSPVGLSKVSAENKAMTEIRAILDKCGIKEPS